MMDNQELNSYIKEVINFSFNSNKYFNDLEPWKIKKTYDFVGQFFEIQNISKIKNLNFQ